MCVRHPLEWIGVAQARGYRVLLDAASFAPGARLDLGAAPADFVALSYYKIFGDPTGVGALIARRDALAELRRRYFGGQPRLDVPRAALPAGYWTVGGHVGSHPSVETALLVAAIRRRGC